MAGKKCVVPGSAAYFRQHLDGQCEERILGLSGFVRSVLAEQVEDACNAIKRTFDSRPVPILVHGETGTGKELVYEAIRARLQEMGVLKEGGEPVKVNCASIPEHLFESELFGHVEGAFSGANSDKAGLLEEANGDVLFLDEIGELPKHVQAKLLRAIQDGTFRRVGDTTNQTVRCAVVAATNNVENLRPDVRWRFSSEVHLWPLRDRRIDIFAILYGHLRRQPGEGREWRISNYALLRLLLSPWKGNVRELLRVADQSIRQAERNQTTVVDLLFTPEYRKPVDLRWEEGFRETWNRFVERIRSKPGKKLLKEDAFEPDTYLHASSPPRVSWSIPEVMRFLYLAQLNPDLKERFASLPDLPIGYLQVVLGGDNPLHLLPEGDPETKPQYAIPPRRSAVGLHSRESQACDLTRWTKEELLQEYYAQMYARFNDDKRMIAEATGQKRDTISKNLRERGIRPKRTRGPNKKKSP